MKRECETCVKHKTPYCPTSIECIATDDMPYYQNIIMLLEENKRLKANWNKLKDYFNERIEVCDNRLSSLFCNFEKTTKERLIFSQCLEKLEELEESDSNVKD